MSALEPPLTTCDCCEGLEITTDDLLENAPALDAIAYRIGTHSTFLESMRARVSTSPLLARLTTRQLDDPSMALLDAWATTLDVLTFYQERIANEGYLRTARERLSIGHLASTIGYRLGAGVAASTWLAFTLETAAPSPRRVTIAAGTKVQSLPGPDEKPQTFETVEPIEARPEWNAIPAAVSEPMTITFGATEIHLEGVATALAPGDALLIVGAERLSSAASEAWDIRMVKRVETNRDRGTTRVTLAKLGARTPPAGAVTRPTVFALRQRAGLFGGNAPMWRAMPDSFKDEYASSDDDEWESFSIDGVNDAVGASSMAVHLDAIYPKVAPDGWLVLAKGADARLYRVESVAELAPALFTLTTKSTQATLTGPSLSPFDTALRTTAVLAQSEELAIAERPLLIAAGGTVLSPVTGTTLELVRFVGGLAAGQRVIVSGRRIRGRVTIAAGVDITAADGSVHHVDVDTSLQLLEFPAYVGSGMFEWPVVSRDGIAGTFLGPGSSLLPQNALDDDAVVSEVATIGEVIAAGDAPTTLEFEAALAGIYDRATVTVQANVAPATHGETKKETLGGGNAAEAFQSFTLRNDPLTYVSAATPSGSLSTLEIRVDGILWHEVTSLYGRGPRERVYVTRIADDGTVTVTFGDGITGARLPTGSENVTATYRIGTGKDGEVDAGQLSLLLTRPLGVKGALGPMAPDGAGDPEVLADARANAPRTVLTLDRVVSLLDFENFARGFGGIGKSQAEWIWNGGARIVFVTVAAAGGGEVATGSALFANLKQAIAAATDGLRPFRVGSYSEITFGLAARILVDPDHIPETVLAAIEAALVTEYSFERREFGDGLGRGEVIATIQRVAGVVAVDLDTLHRSDATPSLETYLPARRARWVGGTIEPAELLVIDPIRITLTEMTP